MHILLTFFCAALVAGAASGAEKTTFDPRKASLEVEHLQMQPVLEFLAKGGDANARNEYGGTYLETATNWNYPDIVQKLLARGASVNECRPSGECALFISASRDTAILQMLLAAGADTERERPDGYTPLGRVAENRPEIFASLLETGGYRGVPPNSPRSAELLLQAGANPNHVISGGKSPLRIAVRNNSLGVAAVLLKAGADVHQRLGDDTADVAHFGDTILMEAIRNYESHRDIRSIELLLTHGANPNDRNTLQFDGDCEPVLHGICNWRAYTVLTYAARKGWPKVVRVLLLHGADRSLPRGDGLTALELAVTHNHASTARELRNQYTKRK